MRIMVSALTSDVVRACMLLKSRLISGQRLPSSRRSRPPPPTDTSKLGGSALFFSRLLATSRVKCRNGKEELGGDLYRHEDTPTTHKKQFKRMVYIFNTLATYRRKKGDGKNPKPKTETRTPTPEREMGKREKDKRKRKRRTQRLFPYSPKETS